MNKLITVFTATYNRKDKLPRLYESLVKQTNKSFEWIVIDDGSDDGSENLFDIWTKENRITITYKKISNGGKHRAINYGVKLAKGYLFFCVDSDDYLPCNTIDRILFMESTIPIGEKQKFCGVCGCRFDINGNLIGHTFDIREQYIDCKSSDRGKYGISGDKSEIVYTSVIKKYPFPEIENEKFCTEAVVWNRIAHQGYKFRYFNENIYICEYQLDGLSKNLREIVRRNPRSLVIYCEEYITFFDVSVKEKVRLLSLCDSLVKINGIHDINIRKKFNLNLYQYVIVKVFSYIRIIINRY